MKKKEFDLNKLTVRVKKSKDKYVLFISELSLAVVSKSLDNGYRKLEAEISKKIKEFVDIGEKDVLERNFDSDYRIQSKKFYDEIILYVVKFVLSLVIIALVLVVISPVLFKVVRDMVNVAIVGLR